MLRTASANSSAAPWLKALNGCFVALCNTGHVNGLVKLACEMANGMGTDLVALHVVEVAPGLPLDADSEVLEGPGKQALARRVASENFSKEISTRLVRARQAGQAIAVNKIYESRSRSDTNRDSSRYRRMGFWSVGEAVASPSHDNDVYSHRSYLRRGQTLVAADSSLTVFELASCRTKSYPQACSRWPVGPTARPYGGTTLLLQSYRRS
jgi:hypothetical protein